MIGIGIKESVVGENILGNIALISAQITIMVSVLDFVLFMVRVVLNIQNQ